MLAFDQTRLGVHFSSLTSVILSLVSATDFIIFKEKPGSFKSNEWTKSQPGFSERTIYVHHSSDLSWRQRFFGDIP